MSQSPARAARRYCDRKGHARVKTLPDNPSRGLCLDCRREVALLPKVK